MLEDDFIKWCLFFLDICSKKPFALIGTLNKMGVKSTMVLAVKTSL